MKSLVEYINESKVSFQKQWDEDGTVYNQMITIGLEDNELKELNNKIEKIMKDSKNPNKDGVISGDGATKSMYLSKDLPLKKGKNYLHLSTLSVLKEIGIEGSEKLKNKNTILNII